jgi:AmmeMemoRadiSam system protein B
LKSGVFIKDLNYGIIELKPEEKLSIMMKLFHTFIVLCIIFFIFIPSAIRKEVLADKIKGDTAAVEENDLEKTQVRRAAVSGTFYPSDPDTLEEMIKTFLTNSKEDKNRKRIDGRAGMILVPHAGLVFSGATAAYAYSILEGDEYNTVILIGSPHQVAVRGASVYCGDGFAMPSGIVQVDRDLANNIVHASKFIMDSELSHLQEHSLEVQLPFLIEVLKGFSIVPILVMGDQNTLISVAHGIVKAVSEFTGTGRKVLYIISTDLSHFPEKTDALRSDFEILEAFCSLNGDALIRADKNIMDRNITNLSCTMCGLDAAYVGIQIANAYRADRAVILHRSVSSDAGIKGATDESVVGYASVAIIGMAENPLVTENTSEMGM